MLQRCTFLPKSPLILTQSAEVLGSDNDGDVSRWARLPTVLLAAKTYGSVFYDELEGGKDSGKKQTHHRITVELLAMNAKSDL